MQIKDLPSTSTVQSTDLLVKEQANGTTEKIAIGNFVVNNLISGSTNPVSSGAVYESVITLTQTAITWNTTNVTGDDNKKYYQKIGRLVIAGLEFTPLSGKIANNNVIASGFPLAKDANLVVMQSNKRQMKIDNAGNLVWWYPTDTSDLSRVDITLVYFAVS